MSSGPLLAWPLAPERSSLGVNEVHVWLACLRMTDAQIMHLRATLSPEERERSVRYRFVRDQQRFIVARGLLRSILGSYLGTLPDQIRLSYNPHGKPELEPVEGSRVAGTREEHIQFNVTHTEDVALYAVARGRRVGIDVERIRPGFADDRLSETFFAPREAAALRSLPPNEQQKAFFACWTRKEAYVKARGEGLVMPLDAFEVSLLPGDPPTLLTPDDPAEAARWSLCELDLGPEYAATLAVEGQRWRLRLWRHPAAITKEVT